MSAVAKCDPSREWAVRRGAGDVWELSRRGDADWSLIMAAGELDSHYHYVLSLETELVERLGRHGTREVLEGLCVGFGVDVARTHVDFDVYALRPDEWDGPQTAMGWFQYFGPTWVPMWPDNVWRASVFDARHLPNGGVSVCVDCGPLEQPLFSQLAAPAEALGIKLRPPTE